MCVFTLPPMTSPLHNVPLYRQLADRLAREIEEGKLRPGQPLPSELHLQQTYGVARGTVRMAMRELRERGLVVTVHARGTFVAARP
ncbi:GntR family transcriptional regulator [Micromonospora sp. WMMD714]|nr:GntR family transcriptional regulator [Micromonospora sp. WMMD714]WFE67340.1 GntR family transcriptional regulator [Micromonospora sp. WMMD714]